MKYIEAIKPLIDFIVSARKEKQLTQDELGKRLGLPQSYISRLESGRLDIRLSSLVELARYLRFEVMFVPVSMTPAVQALLGNGATAVESKPMYTLDELD